jgi:alkanesulfonate monooxygenase SsuD/methylene tetrahydromethanopterin reductase-like flavin-dependent oxidoreductase (luciferase family)
MTARPAIKVGMFPPGPGRGSGGLRGVLSQIADAEIDHVIVGDHVSFRTGSGMDGLIQATALAMLHPVLPVHVGVYQLPLRHPVLVARQISTVARLAPGRLVFGVGAGGEDRHEVTICGVNPATRGRRMDESLCVLRELLRGTAVSSQGQFFQMRDALVLPAPDPAVPIVVGGRSDAAIRRAGRFGDGWLGVWVSPARFAAAVAMAGETSVRAGRSDVSWRHGMQVWCGFGASRELARPLIASAMEKFYGIPFERFAKYSPHGTPRDIAEFLLPYAENGCGYFNLQTCAAAPAEAVEGVRDVKNLLSAHLGPGPP